MQRYYKEESRKDWRTEKPIGENMTTDEIQFGAILRLADAAEKIAGRMDALCQDQDRLRRDLDFFKRCAETYAKDSERRARSNAALRGVITRMKRKGGKP